MPGAPGYPGVHGAALLALHAPGAGASVAAALHGGPPGRTGRAELDAAGITTPALRAAYTACRRLNAAHGKTYYLATLLLPAAHRPAVHALYGFARWADEIVDDVSSPLSDAEKALALRSWAAAVLTRADAGDPVTPALYDTVDRYGIDPQLIADFLHSMAMDLTVTDYADDAALAEYTWGSAAVIGLQMLPVLGHPGVPLGEVAPYAAELGVAFQLANFLRDVGEDYARGRVYLPADSLAAHGVARDDLGRPDLTPPVRALLRHEVARTRQRFAAAEPGIALLHPASRDCVRTAFRLYGGILDAIEAADYAVLRQRVSVPTRRRLRVAGPAVLRARAAARRAPHPAPRALPVAAARTQP